jgi:frataxin-like iron-binding protein CyaY
MSKTCKISNGKITFHMDKYDYDEIKKIICTMYPLATYVDKMFDEIKLDKDLKDGDYITIYDSFTILIFNKKTASNRGWFYTASR